MPAFPQPDAHFSFLQARLRFPVDYPYSPPAFRFLTKMWHPNIYEVGRLGRRGSRVRLLLCYGVKMPAFVWRWSTAPEARCLALETQLTS